MKYLWWMQGPLFEAAGEGGSGGGSGAGAGTGEGDGKSGTFDAAAFKAELKTELMGEFNKTLNGFGKSLKGDVAKLLEKSGSGSGSGSGTGSGEGSGTGAGEGAGTGEGGEAGKITDPAVKAQLRAMERRLKDAETLAQNLKTENESTKRDADQKDLAANLRTKLSGKFKFADEAALEDAFEIFAPKVKRDENGAIVGHDGTPIDQYLEEQMRTRAYLLAPKDVNGANARTGGRAGSHKSTLDDIDNMQKLSPEDKTRLRQDVADAMAAAQSGR